MEKELITIGFDKNGQADFGVSCNLAELPLKKMVELRAMIPVAIGIAEEMFRRGKEELPETN